LAERGALLLTKEQQQLFPAPAATEVDPTGAGDTFCGTFLSLLAQGHSPTTCGGQAIRAASSMIGYAGPAGLLL
jgi:sugar/nucleoside kinase (ribokinase family)